MSVGTNEYRNQAVGDTDATGKRVPVTSDILGNPVYRHVKPGRYPANWSEPSKLDDLTKRVAVLEECLKIQKEGSVSVTGKLLNTISELKLDVEHYKAQVKMVVDHSVSFRECLQCIAEALDVPAGSVYTEAIPPKIIALLQEKGELKAQIESYRAREISEWKRMNSGAKVEEMSATIADLRESLDNKSALVEAMETTENDHIKALQSEINLKNNLFSGLQDVHAKLIEEANSQDDLIATMYADAKLGALVRQAMENVNDCATISAIIGKQA